MTASKIFGCVLGLAVLASCGERDVILLGERVDLRDGIGGETGEVLVANQSQPISFAAPIVNAEWTHRSGGPQHSITHPAYAGSLEQIWSANIGQGDSRRARITADPVVSNGAIFTLDARAQVVATSTAGERLWSRDLTPTAEAGRDASGGGIAVDGGKIFVSTGFGEISALDIQTGAVLWTQDLDAPGGSAPTVFGDLVYVAARDSQAWAIGIEDGRIRFTMSGTPSESGFSGGAGAAVNDELAIFPFPSGEVIAAFRRGGLQRWNTTVSGERDGRAAATSASDISADPVIDGNRVYVGNQSGRVVALNIGNGERIWTATEGALSPVLPAGGSVFLVNDLNELVRLNDEDGSRIWGVQLPVFVEGRARRQRTVYAHYGPLLAGGRLYVASSDGNMRAFDPTSGGLIGAVSLAGGAASNPIVAGGVLYVVTKRGQLVAFR